MGLKAAYAFLKSRVGKKKTGEKGGEWDIPEGVNFIDVESLEIFPLMKTAGFKNHLKEALMSYHDKNKRFEGFNQEMPIMFSRSIKFWIRDEAKYINLLKQCFLTKESAYSFAIAYAQEANFYYPKAWEDEVTDKN